MPIKSCTLPDGGSGWKWGDSGTCYADRADAERQAAAAHANGYTGDGIHTTEEIGPNQGLTPEGFLLCRDVAIARTGVLVYHASELEGIQPDETGFIYVTREPEQVFSDTAMASFEGKPVTNLHPNDLVGPDTWSQVAVGTVQNVRRRENLLVADLLITQAAAIRDVQLGLREVSCGYEARYEQTEPGKARQLSIVGNHVALVPRGRCGATCSIKDHEMKKPSWKGLLRAVLGTKDEAVLKATIDAMPDDDDDDKKDDDLEKKVQDAVAKALKARDEAADEEERKKREAETKDGNDEDDDPEYTGDSYATVVQRAAIVAPGLQLTAPTGDAKSKVFKDAVCGCKLQALRQAYATEPGKKALDALLAGRSLDKLKGRSLDSVFSAAAVLMAHHNNTKDSAPRAVAKDAVITKNELFAANIAKAREAAAAARKI